jgi:hypothetical protein
VTIDLKNNPAFANACSTMICWDWNSSPSVRKEFKKNFLPGSVNIIKETGYLTVGYFWNIGVDVGCSGNLFYSGSIVTPTLESSKDYTLPLVLTGHDGNGVVVNAVFNLEPAGDLGITVTPGNIL